MGMAFSRPHAGQNFSTSSSQVGFGKAGGKSPNLRRRDRQNSANSKVKSR